MKITIIGAGLGGLTFGALAARDGHEVEIYDKNSKNIPISFCNITPDFIIYPPKYYS